MGIVNIFSRRQRRMRGELFPDVYQYDDLPPAFRKQVLFILSDLFSYENPHWKNKYFDSIRNVLARELKDFNPQPLRTNHPLDEVLHFFVTTTNVEDALSVIEFSFGAAEPAQREIRDYPFKMTPSEAVKELNTRFMEHGIGYQLESNRIVRIDSKFLHQEAVKPALQLLKAKHYAGANEEFRKAHEHYRHQRYSEALNECLKALESTLKVICKKRKWTFSDRDTAKNFLRLSLKMGSFRAI